MSLKDRLDYVPFTRAKAEDVDENFITIFDGDYHQKLAIWDAASRPTSPIAQRTIGFNTDINGVELFMGAAVGWLILNARWSSAPDASTLSIAEGSIGFNITSGQWEGYDGTNWNLLG